MKIERALEIIENKIKCLDVKTNLFLNCNKECGKCPYNHGNLKDEKDALTIAREHLYGYLDDISHFTK